MHVDRLELDTVVAALAQHNGYRSIWIDLHGRLIHSEPDEELEVYGYEYVATVMRPDAETLATSLSRHVSPAPAPAPPVPVATTLPGFAPA